MLHESLAINLYLARKHGGPLAPKDVAGRGPRSDVVALGRNRMRDPRAEHLSTTSPPIRRRSATPTGRRRAGALPAPLAVLDEALAEGRLLMGGRFTVADINVAEIIRYAKTGATRAFRRRSACEGLARSLPGPPGLQGDVAGARRRGGLIRKRVGGAAFA